MKQFPRYWPFVRGIHRSPANSQHKGQWRGALMFSLICARINDWVTNREAGDLTRRRAHYDVTVMVITLSTKQCANLWESRLHSSVSTGHHRYLKDKNACRWLIESVMYIMGMMLHNDSMVYIPLLTLQWRHNGSDSLSNHQPHDCFINHLFRHRWKKTPKLCIMEAGEFPTQITSHAENVSISWRHHENSEIINSCGNPLHHQNTMCSICITGAFHLWYDPLDFVLLALTDILNKQTNAVQYFICFNVSWLWSP